ncbi:sensor histidine kinase [Actinomadura harenae]|nr:sensor histidine kinase [Actinomadura harenae]
MHDERPPHRLALGGPRPPLGKRLRPWHWVAIDGAVAVVLGAIVLRAMAHLYGAYNPHHLGFPRPSPLMSALAVLAVVTACAGLVLRRPRPSAGAAALWCGWTLLVTVAGRYALAVPAGTAMVVAATLLVYQISATRPLRWAAAAFGLTLGSALLTAPLGSSDLQQGAVVCAFAVSVAAVTGRLVHRNRTYAAELRRHQAALLHGELTQQRLRVAREVHDVIAHSMSVVGVQSGYGRFVIDKDPALAAEALDNIRQVSHDSLRELRGLLAVLRTTADDGVAPPAPGLADLGPLADRIGRAGVRVDLTVTGDTGDLPPGVALAAYRIVQEALTNVVRHAGSATANAAVTRTAEVLTIAVRDDGPGPSGHTGEGHGLAGIAERAALHGGRVEAGPAEGGGFLVRAVLPLTGDAR